jgi:hypothetical protein
MHNRAQGGDEDDDFELLDHILAIDGFVPLPP